MAPPGGLAVTDERVAAAGAGLSGGRSFKAPLRSCITNWFAVASSQENKAPRKTAEKTIEAVVITAVPAVRIDRSALLESREPKLASIATSTNLPPSKGGTGIKLNRPRSKENPPTRSTNAWALLTDNVVTGVPSICVARKRPAAKTKLASGPAV